MSRRKDSGDLDRINALTERIIACAMEVHKTLGPGLVESLYERALAVELDAAGLKYTRQVVVPVVYKGVAIGEQRLDLIVENEVIVELKTAEKMNPLFAAQLLCYLRVTGKRVGLLLNFNTLLLRQGIKRVIL